MRIPRDLLGDDRQFASVRRIVLDDGPEQGVSALAFSTGGGLDFWVLAGRSFDIGPLWYRGCPMAWQSPGGFRSPALLDPEQDEGRGFDRGFSGLLVTCGLDHIRQPAGTHPQHGRLPFTPGRLLAAGEDFDAPEPALFCEGEVVQSRYGGEALRLRRRITAPVGGTSLEIRDEVENLGPEPASPALLYHLNFGFPAIGPGTTVATDAGRLLGPLAMPEPGPLLEPTCHPAVPGGCVLETPGSQAEPLRIRLSVSSGTLPWLQLWRDLRPRVGVLALEPCTSQRLTGGASGPGPILAPGERLSTSLRLTFSGAIEGPGG